MSFLLPIPHVRPFSHMAVTNSWLAKHRMMLLSALCLNIAHPGIAFGRESQEGAALNLSSRAEGKTRDQVSLTPQSHVSD